MKYIFFISLPLYLLDRITKYWVLHSIDPDQPVAVVPGFFHLVNITNTGAAFGSFKNNNAFFIAISCLALLFALILLLGRHGHGASDRPRSLWWTRNFWRDLALALLLAGVLGNLTDRLLYGHLIDFLLFYLHRCRFLHHSFFSTGEESTGTGIVATALGRRDSHSPRQSGAATILP